MVDTADIAGLGALIGDRTRAGMLVSLMSGQAQTATELAHSAGVTKQTASSHLAKLVDAGLLAVATQGRHRYFHIADRRVARLLETMVGIAAHSLASREFGPADLAMRKARVCYDHIAGELGVLVHDSLQQRGMLRVGARGLDLTHDGGDFFRSLGIDVDAIDAGRRPLARQCLDWSMRRYHLAGALGAALLDRCLERDWAYRKRNSRVLSLSATGERALRRAFPVKPAD